LSISRIMTRDSQAGALPGQAKRRLAARWAS
jgi:hypothetical protein